MPLNYYENQETGEVKAALKPLGEGWKQVLIAPNSKFMELKDPQTGKSVLRNQTAILKARARNHSRDVDLDDSIQRGTLNSVSPSLIKNNFLNNKGEKRRRIDDI